MPRKQMNMKNLVDLDGGKANLLINHHLRHAIADIEDRPADKSVRTVTVTIAMAPRLGPEGVLEDVAVQFSAATRTPKRHTRVYPMAMVDGALMFQTESPFDPHQPGLPGFDATGQADQPTESEETP